MTTVPEVRLSHGHPQVYEVRDLPLLWDEPYAFVSEEPLDLPSGLVWAHHVDGSPECPAPELVALVAAVMRTARRSERRARRSSRLLNAAATLAEMRFASSTVRAIPMPPPQSEPRADATPAAGYYDIVADEYGNVTVRQSGTVGHPAQESPRHLSPTGTYVF